METPSRPRASPVMIALAMGALYFFWGSTYLGIKIAVEGYEPFFMAAVRNLIAGALIYAFVRLRGAPAPTRESWKVAAIVGGLLLLGGNGLVTYASRYAPSGVVSVIVATLPLWMVLLDRPRLEDGSRSRVGAVVVGGVLIGFAGVIVLIAPMIAAALGASADGVQAMEGVAVAICLISSLCWAVGSMYSKRTRARGEGGSPFRDTGMQLLCGGMMLLIASVALGEPWRMTTEKVFATPWPTVAIAYLVVFGSLVGYSAYIWLLSVAPAPRVATYAYVNPIVALLIGWAIGGEQLSTRTIVAASIIIGSVAVIVSARASPAAAKSDHAEESQHDG